MKQSEKLDKAFSKVKPIKEYKSDVSLIVVDSGGAFLTPCIGKWKVLPVLIQITITNEKLAIFVVRTITYKIGNCWR